MILIITRDSDANVCDVTLLLKEKIKMKDLGELQYFLGIKVIRSPSGIQLLKRQYGLDMLSKYGLTRCKPILVPLEQNTKLSANIGKLLEDVTMYRHIMESLIYMTITKPDLSYVVGLVSQFMQAPRKSHLDATRRILQYVKSMLYYKLSMRLKD